ncbi:hypothetical protein GH975_03075 [Litorivicinus lipolyticus]|uniref:histidine kinase n=1 Tax=Litorivicinus lipolyticus TaxID=418701 RepID=A0A5Q2Q8Z1_9GAMM|nr:histidine kinase dimerization/phospho-acceptor domain-containing protein [Litorivicinus lipolyticus]QGG79603.1 hypothetical protein GH975_03075 [Litorivicinus lipolyticus]
MAAIRLRHSLWVKLIPIGLALALLPWLGWQALNTLSTVARDAQAQSLRALGGGLARQLSAESARFTRANAEGAAPVPSIGFALEIDGFLEEWPASARLYQSAAFDWLAVQHGNQVYMAIETRSPALNRWQISLGPPGDDSQIRVQTTKGRTQAELVGVFARRLAVARWDWPDGYRLEFAVPLALLPPSGLVQIDAGGQPAARFPVSWHDPVLLSAAALVASPSTQVSVLDAQGRRLARAGGPANGVRVRLPVVAANQTLGFVELESPLDPFFARSLSQIDTLIIQLSVVVLVIVLGLLGLMTGLSRRIRRLQRELTLQLGDKGTAAVSFSDTQRPDEIGQLARDMQRLLGDLTRYNRFLVRIPRTLRHELANPMSTIQSSIELLEDEQDPAQQTRLRDAALRGIARLNSTLNRITEAANLEESVRQDPKTLLDLGQLARRYLEVCRQQHPDFEWRLTVPPDPVMVIANDLRVEQLLDKAIDNARSFTPAGGIIQLLVQDHLLSADLEVRNQGPSIAAGADPFQMFIGTRSGTDGTHLGLGLYVVQLIANAMGARAYLRNVDGGVSLLIEGFQVGLER